MCHKRSGVFESYVICEKFLDLTTECFPFNLGVVIVFLFNFYLRKNAFRREVFHCCTVPHVAVVTSTQSRLFH